MLTRLGIRNFKRFRDADIELGSPVVFVGPNNSGKTSALQALALWDIGLRRWREKRGGKRAAEQRTGVAINRRDLVSMPLPDANLLWRNLQVREADRTETGPGRRTRNVRIEVVVDGVTEGAAWTCGLEFDYANDESFYCRPLRSDLQGRDRTPIPEAAGRTTLAFLPPMSGLVASETRLDPGAVQVRIGEGRTAEVLRNLCYQLLNREDGQEKWARLHAHMRSLFGVDLEQPVYIAERGEITMAYTEPGGRARPARLDLSCAGRGVQQTLLLLTYLYANPGSALLLDEPDAHLEILRQQQTYRLLTEVAGRQESQIIAASHSEVVLNEAADRDMVLAFVGRPHRIDDRGSQVLKSLKQIGFDQYYLAEAHGWVLYLEGSTDLSILQALAARLGHPAAALLERPFVHYVENQPQKARDHFFGLREAKPDLVGAAIFDQGTPLLQTTGPLKELAWHRREIQNYVGLPEALLAYARSRSDESPPLLRTGAEALMRQCIDELVPPIALADRSDVWWERTKLSDDFLDRLFATFFERQGLPDLMRKSDYHLLAPHVPLDLIDADVTAKLDAILEIVERSAPAVDPDTAQPGPI